MATSGTNNYITDKVFETIADTVRFHSMPFKIEKVSADKNGNPKLVCIRFEERIETDDYELKRLNRWGSGRGKSKPVPKFNKSSCRCGSHLHKSTSSKQCPLNGKNILYILGKLNLHIDRNENIENYINSFFETQVIFKQEHKQNTMFPLWTKHHDPESGSRYYYNHQTKERQWQQPEGHAAPIYNPENKPESGYKYYLNEMIMFKIDLADVDDLLLECWRPIKNGKSDEAIHKLYIDEMNARSKFLENIGCSKMFDCMVCMEQKPLQKIYTNKCSCKAVVCNDCAIQVAKSSDFGDYTCPSCRSKSVFSVAL
jgi:hypothetical protein